MMSEESGDDELGIKPGTVIDANKGNYVVIKLLGEGGFGAVFKVYLETDKSKEYALKVEKKIETRKHSKLKMEIAILKLVSSMRAERSHFTKIIDRGKKPNYFFLVMELVGKSLADLKASRAGKAFTIGTGLSAAKQCLEAVEDLHTQGFIHRDLKPANYACGPNNQKHTIYILDFGIARKIVKKGDELKTPRAVVGFKGTVRFASLACHKNEDMSKKDDCESWFYLLLDLIVPYGLPWSRMTDKNEVRDCKINCRKENTSDFMALYHRISKVRTELVQIINYVDSLAYVETPDYAFIYEMLKQAGKKVGLTSFDDPFDWEVERDASVKRHGSTKSKA